MAITATFAAAAILPLSSPGQKPVGQLSAKAFDGNELKGSYTGNALVIFTQNYTKKHQDFCQPCADLRAVTRSKAFKQKYKSWYDTGKLRVAEVRTLCTW